jgi:hypothetical protein
MVADVGPQPRGGQHIKNFYSRVDALQKAHFQSRPKMS